MNKEKRPFGQFIAGILVASVVCGTMIGVGVGLVQPLADRYTKTQETVIEENAFSFDKLNTSNTTEYTQLQYVPETTTTEIGNKVSPSIVFIESIISTNDYFNRVFEDSGTGSGIIYKQTNDKYYIATNNHVIDGATKINVTFEGGQIVEAKLTGEDSPTDLAVIEVQASAITDETKNLIAIAEFGNSDEIEVGETAVAIGNPLGSQFENSITQGIISALNREISVNDKNLTVIQTDAAINSGNSGGALVNSKAQIIGINSLKISAEGIEGMGFAIPSNIAVPILDDLITNGNIQRPQLGIKGTDVTGDLEKIFSLPIGVYVAEVTPGGSAEVSGIIATDIITDFNGEKIFSMEQLSESIKKCKVGDVIDVRLIRDGKTPMTLKVTLKAQ